MKEKIFLSPSRYIQGTDILKDIPDYVSGLGEKLLLLTSQGNHRRLQETYDLISARNDFSTLIIDFNGECTMAEINRLNQICREHDISVIAGVGGGKVIDTAKAVSHFMDLGLVIVPTTASSDAPCSALSIIYKEDGGLDQLLWLKANPDIVLVDVQIIADAPAHLLAIGMGDAMATYFEMKECYKKDADNFCSGRITLAAKAIATECYKTLKEEGYQAYLAAQEHRVTPALEHVVEANTLLSGIGFESGGICAAHPINNGIAELPETHSRMHGEKVAFSLICQLILAGETTKIIEEIMTFFSRIGLPITLKELGIDAITTKQLELIGNIAAGDPCIKNLPLRADAQAVEAAVILADRMGTDFRNREN